MRATEHRLTRNRPHFAWDRGLEPALVISDGDVVVLDTEEVSGGQIHRNDPAEVVTRIDRTRTYPLTGPIYVDGAKPGDTLAIDILEVSSGSWGWTAIFPGRGLLPDDFPSPYIRYSALTAEWVEFLPGLSLKPSPFLGTVGVAPDRQGPIAVRPPHEGGGNIDTRQLTRGSTLYLPILVEGALLSAGDGHAIQGDGEVCLTAVECDLTVALRLRVVRGRGLPAGTYQFVAPRREIGHELEGSGVFAAAASGPDLRENARNAVRGLIGWLEREHHLGAQDAYLLCSLAADLRISQVVNDPNWCVTAILPLSIFEASANG